MAVPTRTAATALSSSSSADPDLVVLSHLRWTWVWQRPQHLVSRFAVERAARGAHTWFVEEPEVDDVAEPELRVEPAAPHVTRVWLAVPHSVVGPDPIGFDHPDATAYAELLADFLSSRMTPARAPDVLLYTPMAYPLARGLAPRRIAYDVMDDLASFAKAPVGMRLQMRRLIAEADVVFAGGRSLYQAVAAHRTRDCHLYPSGVDTAHYARSIGLRTPHHPPVAGYVGVLDERIDVDLVAQLAHSLPDWTLRLVGPVTKIEPAALPQAANISYPGQVDYAQLPTVMAGFDVALMPFALNEATRSISPTKTLEYLAAGLPVVSTRVADVVADYGDLVYLADQAIDFAAACRAALHEDRAERDRRLRRLQGRQEWDVIATDMAFHIRGPEATKTPLGGATA